MFLSPRFHPAHFDGVHHPADFSLLVDRGQERTFVDGNVSQGHLANFGTGTEKNKIV